MSGKYKVIDKDNLAGAQEWEHALNRESDGGWQLISMVPISRYQTRLVFFYAPEFDQ